MRFVSGILILYLSFQIFVFQGFGKEIGNGVVGIGSRYWKTILESGERTNKKLVWYLGSEVERQVDIVVPLGVV